MSTRTQAAQDAGAEAARGALQLSRGISATWWYTAGGILFLDSVLVLVWVSDLLVAGRDPGVLLAVGVGGVLWALAQVPVLLDYRNRPSAPVRRRRALVPLAVAAGYGALLGIAAEMWLGADFPVVQLLVLLVWAPGLRRRIVTAATLVLAALTVIDVRGDSASEIGVSWWLVGFYSTMLPAMSVLSLWWWDVLVSLDRARAAESRLGATQERLRVATDVHDLQGHHLQVIALQLELAERLMAQDPEAALAQLRAARTSVDEARQGTRDLATRFRSVPLGDELANAVDLLRAAGVEADLSAHPAADSAPASVLGPVIRETTTNVLRHGGGRWARLSLQPEWGTGSAAETGTGADAGTEAGTGTGTAAEPPSWRFTIANDADGDAAPGDDGSGLEGIGRRVAEAEGRLEVDRGRQAFTVSVTVPARESS